LGAQAAQQFVAGGVVRMRVAALGRGQQAGAGSGVALVGQGGQPKQRGCGIERAEEAGGPGASVPLPPPPSSCSTTCTTARRS
jgi:hypothetical protein